jgi:UDPglucose 6-dehydrogenase
MAGDPGRETMTIGACRLSVIGTGYLGATHAVCMASLGHDVIAVDVDARKVDALQAGRVPFFEPGLDEFLQEMLATGRLRFSTDIAEAARSADVHFVCVGTPQQPDSDAADLSYVHAAIEALAPQLRPGALVVGKSTVPLGTAGTLAATIAAAAPTADAELAWNPEFLREGYAVTDTLRPDRLVLGVSSERAERVLRAVYAPITDVAEVPVIVTGLATAELVKVAANSFLATKISFINAMAEICEHIDADVMKLTEALAHDARIGGRFLRPGLGFGGGCLPKDIRAFRHRAAELGFGETVNFLREVDAINARCRTRTVEAVASVVGALPGARIAALGAAFKPDSDDIRDAPALAVASMLASAGACVTVFDPAAMDNARPIHPELRFARSAMDAIVDADAIVLLTEWKQFLEIDPAVAATLARGRGVVDARHALDGDRWRAAGWQYVALGSGTLERVELAARERALAGLVS